jgi:hypothetical protein
LEWDVDVIFKTVAAVVAASCLVWAAAPASAQKKQPVQTQGNSAHAPLTEGWLIGRWSTARAKVHTTISEYSAYSYSKEYWLDVVFSRRSDGRVEAEVTARQMADETEFVTWKADVSIVGDLLTVAPREIVGEREWRMYSPDTFQLKRRDSRLVGRTFTKLWNIDMSSSLITLER